MRTHLILGLLLTVAQAFAAGGEVQYKLLATSKTSTMEREMNQAADAGYVFSGVMGGETALGGNEVVVVMWKPKGADGVSGKRYKLLATSKTSTMQKEMQAAADEGFAYLGQTVFVSAFGGREVGVIMERNVDEAPKARKYLLLATSKTGTMNKELNDAGGEGYQLRGVTVAKTAFGGSELVCILEKQ
ncbi:MAG: hypothetical protein R2729_19135 [Bryobacteraceae bacterium]